MPFEIKVPLLYYKHYMLRLLISFILLSTTLLSQNSLIGIDAQSKDIGTQENIYKVKVDYVIQNNQLKNLYLLRADAKKGISIHTSKKTIKPNDTALIVVEFIPEHTGKFNETINLVTSADGTPYPIIVSGNIKSIKTDDKTACFYFKRPNNAGVKTLEPIVVTENTAPRDNSNKMPDNTGNNTQIKEAPVVKEITTNAVSIKQEALLDEALYKPNNIVFVVDISSSMKDSTKLPVMKQALYYLIDALRPSDKVTVITYADSVKLLKDGVSGQEKKELQTIVSSLKARGLTKGKKAILYGLDIALKNYIEGGNNQIILVTDGKFRFYPDDQKLFVTKQNGKHVLLSTIALGNDKDALSNLKEIAQIGNGNFIHVKNSTKAKEQLLNEIKQHSLK